MSTSMPSVAFIICTEKGLLEKKSLLFAKSLRKFGGLLKDAPIYSLSPRAGKDISKSTKEKFIGLNVIHEHHNLNRDYDDYGLANKVVACTYFEKQLEEEILIFCDSDQVVLGDLAILAKCSADIALQYVAKKGIGSNGNDENAAYWNKLYNFCEVEKQQFIELADGQRMLQYFNSGLIVVKREIGLFQKWNNNFNKVMQEELQPSQGRFFVEQSVFSATVSSLKRSIKVLPVGYNFNLFKHSKIDEAVVKIESGKIKLLHYHTAFDGQNFFEIPKNISLSNSSKLQWLNQELIHLGISTKPFVSHLENQFIQDQLKSAFKFKTNKRND